MRPVAAAMMFAVVAMLSASCLEAENMTPAQKACCAAMNHDCGQMAISEGCCTGHTQETRSLSPATRVETATPALPVLVAVLDVPEPLASAPHFVRAASTTPVKPPGTSTYLIVSSFRL